MLRRLLALSALLLPALASAQVVRTVSCPTATPADRVCDGFTLSGGGSVSASVFTTAADEHGLGLYSPTDFTLINAAFQSITASPNTVVVLGYRRNVIDVPFSGFPYPGSWGPYSYIATFDVGAASSSFHFFNWTDLAAIKFDGSGGPTPGAPIPIHDSFDYRISSVVVSQVLTTPEPASILLVASGLLGLLVVARRQLVPSRVE